jgi:glycosyltransferase involved in cell wall biosynthesis
MDPRSWLESIARTPDSAALDPQALQAVTDAFAGFEGFPDPPDLLAAASSGNAAQVHLAGLETAVGRSGEVARERARFHATWLRHLLDPDEASAFPLVTVVIPVYNAAHLVGEAVASALAQTWPAVEVVVVDDGSEDDPAGALAEEIGSGRVRVVRQENRGAAGARNTGVAKARGVFVHFLDADDSLDADAVEHKLAAFRAVPEAEVCVSRYRPRGVGGPTSSAPRGTKLGDAFCPTRDLLATWVRRYPFQTSTVLVQRWVLLEAGPWNEEFSIPHSDTSDSFYWFRLGLRGTRVVALDAELGTRRFREGSLITQETPFGPILFLAALIELLDRPTRWPYLGPLLVRLQGRDRWSWIETSEHPQLFSLREALIDRVRCLGRATRHPLSGKPPLLLLRLHVPAAREGEPGAYRERLASEARAALETARPLGEADLRLWLGGPDAPLPPEENAPAVAALACWLESCASLGALPVPRSELPALASRLGRDPRRRGLVLLGRAPTDLAGRLAWRAERATRRLLDAIR